MQAPKNDGKEPPAKGGKEKTAEDKDKEKREEEKVKERERKTKEKEVWFCESS
jgi:hypothetical protein